MACSSISATCCRTNPARWRTALCTACARAQQPTWRRSPSRGGRRRPHLPRARERTRSSSTGTAGRSLRRRPGRPERDFMCTAFRPNAWRSSSTAPRHARRTPRHRARRKGTAERRRIRGGCAWSSCWLPHSPQLHLLHQPRLDISDGCCYRRYAAAPTRAISESVTVAPLPIVRDRLHVSRLPSPCSALTRP